MEEIKIADLVFKAHRYPSKKVRKCTPTSGAIYLHKSLVGKVFDVILIPTEEKDLQDKEIKNLEEMEKKTHKKNLSDKKISFIKRDDKKILDEIESNWD